MAPSSTAAKSTFSRRQFAGRLGIAGVGTLLARASESRARAQAVEPAPPDARESYWLSVRGQFLMPADLGVMNAANLCPSPAPVVEALVAATRDMDRDPSFPNRVKMGEGKEATRRPLAEFFHVTREEITPRRTPTERANRVRAAWAWNPAAEGLSFSTNNRGNLGPGRVKA